MKLLDPHVTISLHPYWTAQQVFFDGDRALTVALQLRRIELSLRGNPMTDPPGYEGTRYLEQLATLEDRHRSLSFDAIRVSVLAGDNDGWRIFVEKYSRFVYSVALRLLPGPIEGKEDLAQEIYCQVFSHLQRNDYQVLRRFESRCKFTTYLFRMVQTARSAALRNAGRQVERMDFVDFSDEANRSIDAALANLENQSVNGADTESTPEGSTQGTTAPAADDF